jgi:hypothetical protein
MNVMDKWLLLLVLICTQAFIARAQVDTAMKAPAKRTSLTGTLPRQMVTAKPPKPKPIRTELSGGFRLNSDGWSVFADKGWVVSEEKRRDYFYNAKVLQFELSERKHPKETRSTNNITAPNSSGRPRSFIYAKINNFYNFKVGYGMRKMIAGKPEIKTVSIHWVYIGGLSAGLIKPYYIDAKVPLDEFGTTVREDIKYSDSTKSIFLSNRNIYGSSGFAKGLGETQIVPGIYARTALHFDFHTSKARVMAIETGVTVEYYTKKIEMMALQDAVPYYVNIYASIQFGKRWQ